MRFFKHTILPLAALIPLISGLYACKNSLIRAGGPDFPTQEYSPLRRLSQNEYNNTVSELLNDHTQPANQFLSETNENGFDNAADNLSLPLSRALEFFDTARALSKRAVETNWNYIMPCQTHSLNCAQQFISLFGQRAFRRPLNSAEKAKWLSVFEFGQDDALSHETPFKVGIGLVIQGMLVDPNFLYKVETSYSPQGELTQINSWEMASRLSYFLWESMPDDELFLAAQNSQLQTPSQIEAQARRMINDPKANKTIHNFTSQWLGFSTLEHSSKNEFPEYTTYIRSLLKQEAVHFIDSILEDNESVKTLLMAPYTFVNNDLADYYNINSPNSNSFKKTYFSSQGRSGILSMGAVMSELAHVDTSPTMRGLKVRKDLICGSIDPPPPGLSQDIPNVPSDATTKEKSQILMSIPSCKSCHELMDPIGFAFENIDPIGKWRDYEEQAPSKGIDPSGEVIRANSDINGSFSDLEHLAYKLANSHSYQHCIAKKVFQFSIGRNSIFEDAEDIDSLFNNYSSLGLEFKELFIQAVKSNAFMYRQINNS